MQMAEEFDTELIGFEQQLAQQMEHYAPDSIFVQDLKDRLVTSRVFKLRREIGAILVASFALLFFAAITFTLDQLLRRNKRSSSS